MQERIDRAIETTRYDVVIVEHSFTGYYRLPDSTPVVVDQHNVESEILQRASLHERSKVRRALNFVEFWKYRSDERRICRNADLLLATSQRDCEAMERWGGIPGCCVVPNGVDVGEFSLPAHNIVEERAASVLFTGPLHYSPNTEAMLYFGSEIWPLIVQQVPHAQLTIVGANPPREIKQLAKLPGISLTGFVPDVRPYLARAQVVVAPLRIGGGTRLKILEALSMERAVVTTTIGCEGLDIEDGYHLLVADTPKNFAERVTELLADPEKRAAMGRHGRHLVETRYDWLSITRSMDLAVRQLVAVNNR